MPGGVSNKIKNPLLKKALDLYFTKYNKDKGKRFARENEMHAKAAEAGTEKVGPVVFLGDSITDYCDLEKFYPGLNCVNRGISGNTTKDILDRMKVSVFDASPSMVVSARRSGHPAVGLSGLGRRRRRGEEGADDAGIPDRVPEGRYQGAERNDPGDRR